jgi:hypothetical protein
MATVYLAGHGSWDVKSNGFTIVPKGLSVTFYTESMKNLFTGDMFSIISGSYKGEVKQIYDSAAQVPNYTLHPDTKNEAKCRQLLKARVDKARVHAGAAPKLGLMMPIAGQTTTLAKLMSIMGPGTNVVWCACRYTELADTGGKSVGVNGAQGTYGNRNAEGKLGKGDIYFNPGAANAGMTDKGVDLNAHLEYAMASRRKALGY